VTFFTFHLSVIANESITRFGLVVKFFDLLPALSHVTGTTFLDLEFACFKEVNVIFLVTGYTRVYGTKEASVILSSLFLTTVFGVTFLTFDLYMATIDLKSSLFVLKFCLIKGCEIIIAAFMILVTLITKFVLGHQTVKVSLFFHVLINGFMTRKTILVRDPPTRLMALQTIFMFEIIVSQRQRTRSEKLIKQSFEFGTIATLSEGHGADRRKTENEEEEKG
jgi:hypothetical protein